jgi:hypothetical protein
MLHLRVGCGVVRALVGLTPGRRPLVLDGVMSTRALCCGLSHILWSFVTAVYVEWVVITVAKHFHDLFRTGVSQFPLYSPGRLCRIVCVLGTVRDAHEADSLSAPSHLSHTTRDRSLRNYKNNNKVNYDLLEVDGKPRLKRVK